MCCMKVVLTRSTWLVMILFLATGCGHQSFQYTVAEPLRMEPFKGEGEGQEFEAEGQGYLWSDCRTVNQDAVDQLIDRAKAKGFTAVADFEWYDYTQGTWVKSPSCRTEYGWLLGLHATSWWPHATKVKVRGQGLHVENGAKVAGLFPTTSLGQQEPTSREIRKANPHDTTVMLTHMNLAFFLVGAGVGVGHFVDPETRWTAALEGQIYPLIGGLGGSECIPRNRGNTTFAARREKFVNNSFFYSIGPAIQTQYYNLECPYALLRRIASRPDTSAQDSVSEKSWQYGLVGADFGVGNEWRTKSGFFGGCEWIGAFAGVRVWKKGEVDQNGSRITMPIPVTARLLNCRVGMSF